MGADYRIVFRLPEMGFAWERGLGCAGKGFQAAFGDLFTQAALGRQPETFAKFATNGATVAYRCYQPTELH